MIPTARSVSDADDALVAQEKEPRRPNVFSLVANGGKLNFYGLAVAPEITWIRNSTNKLVQRYQDYVPGSARATTLLLQLAEECRSLVKELLLEPCDRESCRIEFVGGTSRAVEVALARAGRPQKVIVSPFEHPSVMEVAKWFVSIAGAELCELHLAAQDHFRSWPEQEDMLVSQIAEALDGVKTATLVLSEVNYATGVVIPVERVIDRLYQIIKPSGLKIILDGAHAAGNNQNPKGISRCSSYVFSAHKWLLAPEPCGVIVSHNPSSGELVPYDAWNNTLPATTVNVHMLAGLVSSLRFLKNLGLERLWEHSRQLRQRFVDRVQSQFVVVGEDTGMETTLLMAIAPRPERRWKFSAEELSAYLQTNAVHALVMKIDPEVPWLRVAFPCFINHEHVNVLCDVLETTLN
ncbi:MAG TPA: aminotransferase class V-fold PLP-dependent enzyme [Candidatus Angelobacter sp.]|jgi:selenocysteine lyase/cysteine desulfurase|nr:aminotransferase class V-fold PLP-dependent enzyme [Candidatus Angelobacter sp.]